MAKTAKQDQAPLAGAQTLARGLTALQMISDSPEGLSVQMVAERLGVHRTIAYRVLATLQQFRFIARGEDGLYHPAAGLAVLGASFEGNLRQITTSTLRRLAEEVRTTVALFVAEAEEQVAISVIVPANVSYQLAFHQGSRYTLQRGAAGIALLAGMPARPGEREQVTQTREKGWIVTYGEIEPDTYGLAAVVPRAAKSTPVCLNVISHRRDVIDRSIEPLKRAAAELSEIIG